MYILKYVHLYKLALLNIKNVYKNIVVKHIIENINISELSYTTRLTRLHFVYAPVPCQKSSRSCICMLEVSILPLSTFF